jgi:hypothetical protein
MHRWVEDAARQRITIQAAHSDLGKFGKQTGAAFGARHSWSGFQGKDCCLSLQQLDIFSGVERFGNVSCPVNALANGAMTPKLSERFASDAQMHRSAGTLNFQHNANPELRTTVEPRHSLVSFDKEKDRLGTSPFAARLLDRLVGTDVRPGRTGLNRHADTGTGNINADFEGTSGLARGDIDIPLGVGCAGDMCFSF